MANCQLIDSPSLQTISTDWLKKNISQSDSKWVILKEETAHITDKQVNRLVDVGESCGKAVIYSDYLELGDNGIGFKPVSLIDCTQGGVLRNDIQYGPLRMINCEKAIKDLDKIEEYDYAECYALILSLVRLWGVPFQLR